MIKRLKIIVLAISILIFVISITQPAFTANSEQVNGFLILILGWIGACAGGSDLAWLANPLIIISWILLLKNTTDTLITSSLALAFSLLFLIFNTVMPNDNGYFLPIASRELGYWLWQISIIFFTIGTAIVYYIEKRSAKENIQPL